MLKIEARRLSATLSRFLRDERGATAIEYAMIAGGIAVAIVVATTTLGTTLTNVYNGVLAVMP